MNNQPTRFLTARSPSTTLAFSFVAVWLGAAAITGPLGVWLAIGGAAVALGVAVLVFERSAAKALLQPSPRLVVLGAQAATLMAVATYVFYPLLARALPFIVTDTARLYGAFRAPSLVVASVALVPVIAGEELVWRGVVQAWLVRRLGAWMGVTSTALVYAMVHAPLGSPVLVAVAFFCGLTWGTLRVATASLVPTLVAHLLWDMLVLLWLPLDGSVVHLSGG